MSQQSNVRVRSVNRVVAGLLLLSAIPVIAGAVRLVQLAGGAEITPANARFFYAPVPVVLHIISASVYMVLGAFQFVPAWRKRKPGWHRLAGRLLVACGLVAGVSGLWMTLFYPWPSGDGVVLAGLRLLFGTAMIVSIVLGVAAIWRRNYAQHEAWMLRSYAIGAAAGTQALTLMVGELITGPPSEISRALLIGAGWVINLAVAEWIVQYVRR